MLKSFSSISRKSLLCVMADVCACVCACALTCQLKWIDLFRLPRTNCDQLFASFFARSTKVLKVYFRSVHGRYQSVACLTAWRNGRRSIFTPPVLSPPLCHSGRLNYFIIALKNTQHNRIECLSDSRIENAREKWKVKIACTQNAGHANELTWFTWFWIGGIVSAQMAETLQFVGDAVNFVNETLTWLGWHCWRYVDYIIYIWNGSYKNYAQNQRTKCMNGMDIQCNRRIGNDLVVVMAVVRLTVTDDERNGNGASQRTVNACKFTALSEWHFGSSTFILQLNWN